MHTTSHHAIYTQHNTWISTFYIHYYNTKYTVENTPRLIHTHTCMCIKLWQMEVERERLCLCVYASCSLPPGDNLFSSVWSITTHTTRLNTNHARRDLWAVCVCECVCVHVCVCACVHIHVCARSAHLWMCAVSDTNIATYRKHAKLKTSLNIALIVNTVTRRHMHTCDFWCREESI